jgi:hypothetical protein
MMRNMIKIDIKSKIKELNLQLAPSVLIALLILNSNPYWTLGIGISFFASLFFVLVRNFYFGVALIAQGSILSYICLGLQIPRSFILVIFICLAYLSGFKSRLHKHRQNSKAFSWEEIALITASIFYAGSSLFGTAMDRLTLMLRSYDLVSHSYILRGLAYCQKLLIVCANDSGFPNNIYVNTYPSAYHEIFSLFFGPALKNNATFLATFGFIIFATFLLTNWILYFSMKSLIFGILLPSNIESRKIINKYCRLSMFIGVCTFTSYFFYMGYLNYILAIAFIILSINLMQLKRINLGLITLLLACEMWTFLFPAVFFFAALNISKLKYTKRNFASALIGAFIAYSFFAYTVLSSAQHTATLLSSKHWPEVFLSLIIGIWVYLKYRKITQEDQLVNAIVSFTAFITLYQCYVISHGDLGNYFLHKTSMCLLLLESIFLLRWAYTVEISHKKSRAFQKRISSKKRRNDVEKRKTLINKSGISKSGPSENIKAKVFVLALVLGVLLMNAPSEIPLVGLVQNKIGYHSPTLTAARNWFPRESSQLQSKSILEMSHFLKRGTPVIFAENIYWYQSTQWINNLNMSWTTNTQRTIDSLYKKPENFVSLNNPILESNILDNGTLFILPNCEKFPSLMFKCIVSSKK